MPDARGNDTGQGKRPSAPTPEAESTVVVSLWYAEHTALLVSTLKWTLLGSVAGLCVGLGTRAFLWSLDAGSRFVADSLRYGIRPYHLLPLALPLCVWIVRHLAPTAKGHGTEAVITAVHQRSGRIDWKVAPVKLLATVITLAFGGSVGKEGPCAQIGAAITSAFADVLRLKDEDRRRLVICGIGAGFSAVFGTPVSGALFGIEVLYLGRIEYGVLFPCLIAGIVAHIVCGVSAPVPVIHADLELLRHSTIVPLSIGFGIAFGLIALLMIESMRAVGRLAARFSAHPYGVAAGGGLALAAFFSLTGDSTSGLGTGVIDASFTSSGKILLFAFLLKIVATSITLETGGSGGVVTPLFFVGATSGVALAQLTHMPPAVVAAFGFVSVLGAATNAPIAAAVMGMELLPTQLGVYAALSAGTAFLLVGHRSIYPSQRLGLSKSGGIDIPLGGRIGDIDASDIRVREGSLTERVLEVRVPSRVRKAFRRQRRSKE